jgi:hypothetical protein
MWSRVDPVDGTGKPVGYLIDGLDRGLVQREHRIGVGDEAAVKIVEPVTVLTTRTGDRGATDLQEKRASGQNTKNR